MPSADRLIEKQIAAQRAQEIGSSTSPFAPKFDYTASKYENNKYNVSGLSYPEDLMTGSQYGGNRVIFYINVSEDSRVLKQGSDVVSSAVQRDLSSKLPGQAAGAISDINKGSANLLNTIASIGKSNKSSNPNNQEVAPGQERTPIFTRPNKRLQAAIALYIPNQLNIRYSVGWGEEDTFALSAIAKGASEVGRSANNDANIARTGGVAAEVLAAMALDKGPLGKDIGVATGVASNPKKEQAFKSVDFRTFTFDYQFSPKSETEAQNVLNIIKAFKYHMHPEFKTSNEFLYLYPSEFDITYYKNDYENLNIHRHTSCVLTEMNVNYTPNGVFSTFKNGMPTQIAVSLTFRELMLLSKETIEKYT